MPIIKFPSKKNEPAFLGDIKEEGYHVYNLKNTKIPGYYPPELPDYPGISLKNLKVDDTVTIRVFFGIGKGKNMRIDGGLIELQIEHIDGDEIFGVIITQLPKGFPLEKGTSLEIYKEEILYKADVTEH
jgi:hypothetical protein